MAKPDHVEIVKQGTIALAGWRSANPGICLDLSRANLREACLRRANLSGADLGWADLSGTDLAETGLNRAFLHKAKLCGSNLFQADLRGASLTQADLSEALLNGADLAGAAINEARLRGARLGGTNLEGADLQGADLRDADLTGVRLGGTSLAMLDFSAVNGLDKVIHRLPSDIGVGTIIRSKGKIPEVFLRGCGVPEEWITQIPAIIGSMQPIQFYSCFISYSHADKSFAQRLYEALQARGIRCWLDEHQLLPGDDPHEQIDRGIRLWDKVLLCASKASLTSWWVDNEIATAFDKEQQLMKEREKKVLALIPLDLDGFLFSKDCPNAKQTQLKTRIAAKFAGWDKDNALFEREFDRLIRALQTDDTGREKPPPSRL